MPFMTCLQVCEFMQLGSKDANWVTKRIRRYCFTDEFAAQFFWFGRKGKHSFSSLKIAKAVAGMTKTYSGLLCSIIILFTSAT